MSNNKKFVNCNGRILDIIYNFNGFLETCSFPYRLRCVTSEDIDEIKDMIYSSSQCHNQSDTYTENSRYVSIIAYHTDTKQITSYITWENYISKSNTKYLYLMWSCTKIDHRRHKLSLVLRLVMIYYGIRSKYDKIVSDTNEASGKLLVEKFGFFKNVEGYYDEEIGNDTNYDLSVNTILILKNLDNQEKHPIYERINELKSCILFEKNIK